MQPHIQGGSYMTGTDLCVLLYKSVPVIFEPPCINEILHVHPSYHCILNTLLSEVKQCK